MVKGSNKGHNTHQNPEDGAKGQTYQEKKKGEEIEKSSHQDFSEGTKGEDK